MAGVIFEVLGADIAAAELNKCAADIKLGLQQGLSAAGELVKGAAKAVCPVDTGSLRGSIAKEVSGNVCTIGTNCEYGGYVEFGTYKMAAQPYLIPALTDNEDAVVKMIEDAINL